VTNSFLEQDCWLHLSFRSLAFLTVSRFSKANRSASTASTLPMTGHHTLQSLAGALVLLAAIASPSKSYSQGEASSQRLSLARADLPDGETTFLGLTGRNAPFAVGLATVSASTQVIVEPSQVVPGDAARIAVQLPGATILVESIAGETLDLSDPVPAGLVGTDVSYKLIRCKTVAQVLGENNMHGFNPGYFGAANADTVKLSVGESLLHLYFETREGTEQWQEVGDAFGPSFNDAALDPNTGAVVFRNGTGATVSLPVLGLEDTTEQRVIIRPGLGFYSLPFSKAVTLAELGDGNNFNSGLFGPSSSADLVLLNQAGTIVRYYYDNHFGGWRLTTDPWGADCGSVLIMPDQGLCIERKGTTSTEIIFEAP